MLCCCCLQYGLVLVNTCNLGCYLLRLNFCDGSGSDQRLKYALDIRFFVVDKLTEKGTLVPKHVGFDT